VRCPGGSRYVIAVLRNILGPMEWTLQLFDSQRGLIPRELPATTTPQALRLPSLTGASIFLPPMVSRAAVLPVG
jgi:hypothetical protein